MIVDMLYSIVKRSYSTESESNVYELIGYAESLDEASVIVNSTKAYPGDIALICDTAHISQINRDYKDMWVADEAGEFVFIDTVSPVETIGWIEFWEGPNTSSLIMINEANLLKVGASHILLASCECARYSLSELSGKYKDTAISAIELTQKYAGGLADVDDVKKMRSKCAALESVLYNHEYTSIGTRYAFSAIICLLNLACSHKGEKSTFMFDTGFVPYNASRSTNQTNVEVISRLIDMSILVRKHIPVSMVALASVRNI